jgi:hypothetical protein
VAGDFTVRVTAMRRAPLLGLFVLLSMVCAAGCSNNKGKIEGTRWRSDAGTVLGRYCPFGYLQLDFNADGTLVYYAGPRTFRGKYVLKPGNTVTFDLDQPLAGRNSHDETIEVYGNKMTVRDSNGVSMTFSKVK